MKGLPRETEDRGGSLLKMDTILPEQFFSLREQRGWSGEQRLMAAILVDALAVYSRAAEPRASEAGRVLRQTQRWLHSDDRTSTCSFLRVCEVLGLEPKAVRRHLREGQGEEAGQGRRLVFSRLKTPRRHVGK
jgi:hypothetical protein